MTRKFSHAPARREAVPVWLSLIGPSGSGKTYSALRLGHGIVSVLGGDVWLIDTEARRSLHYADAFRFAHVPFAAPFGSLDYLAAVQHCATNGAKVVIIDSMSHEHEGPGGYLSRHEDEMTRMGGDDYAKRERVKMAAWSLPVSNRSRMVQSLLQLEVSLIFCFRAKEKIRMVTEGGKLKIEEQGWTAIGGDALLYEMTASCFLPPHSRGHPQWQSTFGGERSAMKLPRQFEGLLDASNELNEEIGESLARWSKGETKETPVVAPAYKEGFDLLSGAAEHGTKALRACWNRLSDEMRAGLKGELDGRFKGRAEHIDTARKAKANAATDAA